MKPNRPLLLYVAVALFAVSCQTPPGPAQTPPVLPPGATAMPQTSAPATEPTAVVDVAVQAATAQFRGPDECQSGPEFELTYALDTWDVQESSLVLRAIPDCTLLLAAHGQQVAGPKVVQRKDLAGYSWEVSQFPNEGLSSYWLEVEGGCYMFVARYSSQAAAETVEQCLQAADTVIDSFRLVKQ